MRDKLGGNSGLTTRDVFGIVVRSLGLYAIYEALLNVVGMILPAEGFEPIDYLVSFVMFFLFGLILFLGADAVVAIAYRTSQPDGEDDIATETPS